MNSFMNGMLMLKKQLGDCRECTNRDSVKCNNCLRNINREDNFQYVYINKLESE